MPSIKQKWNMQFFKSKKFYIILAIIALAGAYGFYKYKKSHRPVEYDTVIVARGDLKQTVEATGKIESVTDLSLRFEIPGTLGAVYIKEGNSVKAGMILANLRLAELNASVAQASANLNQKLAGATAEDIKYYAAAVDSASASLDQSKIDAANSINAAQSAVDTAKNNLKLAEGGENSQIVTQAYDDSVAILQTTLSKLDDALTQSDNILGIDNSIGNDSFEAYLSIIDTTKLSKANALYLIAKQDLSTARGAINILTSASANSQVDSALILAAASLSSMNNLLGAVSEVLRATNALGSLTQSSLDSKKTTIETTRSGITSQLTAVINQQQNVSDAKNSLSSYTIVYNKALQDLEQIKSNAVSSVTIKEASYNQALANYQGKINPPREVDVAAYRALLAQAVASRDKAIIKAPIDGVVTKVNKKVGESATAADVIVQLLSPHYEIEVDIPETDVSKLKINNPVEVTLDAFGADIKLNGNVIAIEPGSTEIQDVVYYKVTVALNDTDKPIMPGMTANVSINTDTRTNAVYVPLRAVKTKEGSGKYVRILQNAEVTEVDVKLGLKADEGKVEIIEGLSEGQTVVVAIKESK